MNEDFNNNSFDEDTNDTVFRDVTLLALSGFVSIVLLLLPWLNLKSKNEATKEPAGSVILELFWNNDLDVDLDLWVRAPGGGPVGYSNTEGLFFNLLRDDRGLTGDHTPLNYEISFTRGIIQGEYQANIHLFNKNNVKSPISAKVIASLVTPDKSYRKQILEKNIIIKKQGKEITALRFKLNNNFELIEGSVNSLRRSLIGN